ncbi:MAG: FecR domain-containing protein [Pseudomonadaceae bacterium]|nr:FecR domain-containing protein [Pseudomonadaceae bacterium]
MNSSTQNRRDTGDTEIEDQAIAWLALLRRDFVSVAHQAEFAQWLARDPAHQLAFDEVTELWAALAEPIAQIAERKALPTSEPSTPAKTIAYPANSDALPEPLGISNQKRRAAPIRYALAASTLLIVAAGLVVSALSFSPINGSVGERWAGLWQGLTTSGQAAIATVLGEQRSLQLQDGSQVTLNTNSELYVTLAADRRQMTLAAGEAYFDVAKDASRPFEVSAGEWTVTAIGTAFSVHLNSAQDVRPGSAAVASIQVVVEEGIVELRGRTGEAVRLGANEQALVSKGDIHSSSVHANDATAWRHGQLIYSDVPLATVISDLNRYLPHPMTIGNDELAATKVSAVLQLSKQSDMLNALSHALPMSWELLSDSLVVIQPTSDFEPEPSALDEA